MPQVRKQTRSGKVSKKPRPGRGETARSDRWPSDYGRRQVQEKEGRPVSGALKKKASKTLENADEQGDRANVRQNTPPKGLRNKR
jgi:hypothetical protein